MLRALLLLAVICPGAWAQPAALPTATELRPMDIDGLYRNRWSAEQMIGTEVRGESGEAIGSVRDILVGHDGEIHKLVVEVGGFLDIGDQHIGVPWPDVTLGPDLQWVQVPLEQVRSGTYALFNRVPQGERVPVGAGEWRARELIGDFASLFDVPRYGLIRDILFDERGEARAVVVARGTGSWGSAGTYVYPWQGVRPDAGGHLLPYRASETLALQRFDYTRFGDVSRLAPARAAAAGGSR